MFTSAQLASYLERIGLAEPRRPTLGALFDVHRAHVDSVPYENLEIQLGRPVRLSEAALFEKIVAGRRGGYCFEQNHVLALALEAMGFTVRRVLGAVARETEGDGNWYNHMPLIVSLPEGEYLADAGLGVGFRDPLPMREGSHRVGKFNFGMWNVEADLWRCSIDPRIQDLSFDFTLERRRIEEFAPKCRELSTSPESPFVKTLTVQRPGAETVHLLRGRTLSVHDPTLREGRTASVIANREDFGELLTGFFGLGLDAGEIDRLWDKALEQHERRLAEDAGKASSASGGA
ncbi:arylamine N-acetyltransferase [Glycomyces halotolerans]